MSDSTPVIEIKGIRDGLLVTLDQSPWEKLQPALMEQIDARQTFFRGARMAIDVGERIFRVNELSELRDLLSERGVNLWAVVSESPTTEKTAQLLGLATRISRPRLQENVGRLLADNKTDECKSLWVERTLRSGTRIEFPGNVTVIGDINPGAEVLAEGSIVVWGRVRGLVHAGVKGNIAAVVCGLDLSGAQVRIGTEAAISLKRGGDLRPEKYFLDHNRIIKSEAW